MLPLHYIRVGAFEEIRTLDPRLRRPLLYPAELRGLKSSFTGALGDEECLNDKTKKIMAGREGFEPPPRITTSSQFSRLFSYGRLSTFP